MSKQIPHQVYFNTDWTVMCNGKIISNQNLRQNSQCGRNAPVVSKSSASLASFLLLVLFGALVYQTSSGFCQHCCVPLFFSSPGQGGSSRSFFATVVSQISGIVSFFVFFNLLPTPPRETWHSSCGRQASVSTYPPSLVDAICNILLISKLQTCSGQCSFSVSEAWSCIPVKPNLLMIHLMLGWRWWAA